MRCCCTQGAASSYFANARVGKKGYWIELLSCALCWPLTSALTLPWSRHEERVRKGIEKLKKARGSAVQSRLDGFFTTLGKTTSSPQKKQKKEDPKGKGKGVSGRGRGGGKATAAASLSAPAAKRAKTEEANKAQLGKRKR